MYTIVYHESDIETDGRQDSEASQGEGYESGGSRKACTLDARVRNAARGRASGPFAEHDQRAGEGAQREGGEAAGMRVIDVPTIGTYWDQWDRPDIRDDVDAAPADLVDDDGDLFEGRAALRLPDGSTWVHVYSLMESNGDIPPDL